MKHVQMLMAVTLLASTLIFDVQNCFVTKTLRHSILDRNLFDKDDAADSKLATVEKLAKILENGAGEIRNTGLDPFMIADTNYSIQMFFVEHIQFVATRMYGTSLVSILPEDTRLEAQNETMSVNVTLVWNDFKSRTYARGTLLSNSYHLRSEAKCQGIQAQVTIVPNPTNGTAEIDLMATSLVLKCVFHWAQRYSQNTMVPEWLLVEIQVKYLERIVQFLEGQFKEKVLTFLRQLMRASIDTF